MVTGGAWVVLSYTCVQCDAKWRPVLVLAAVAVEPIKIRRLNGARTEDCDQWPLHRGGWPVHRNTVLMRRSHSLPWPLHHPIPINIIVASSQ